MNKGIYGRNRLTCSLSLSEWTPSFYGCDGFGSVRQLTNAAGVVTDTYEYDAFGVTLSRTGTTPNVYMYRGEQYDADLGLYYLRARYYNSLTGRFLSRDPESGKPSMPSSLHKYLYASGDPVNRIDPKGKDDWDEYGYEIKSAADEVASIARFGKHVYGEMECIRWALAWMASVGGDPGSAWLMFQYCMGGF